MAEYVRWLVLAVALLFATACGGVTQPQVDAAPSARELLISADDLPKPYRLANGQDYPGELTVCGALLEPSRVRDFAMKRYTRTFAGPFLYQYVFTSQESAGRKLVGQLSRTMRTCSAPTITTSEGDTVSVELTGLTRLREYGDSSIGFRVNPDRRGVVSDYLVIQSGDVVFLLFTVSLGEPAPRALLISGAEAAMGQVE